jgi:hypothetical protein
MGYVTTHPFESSLVNIGEQATLTDSDISHTTDQIVGVEYASHMMAPSATKSTRFHGLSQIIQMNNQGSQRKIEIFQRVKIMSMHKDNDFTVCKNSRLTKRNHTVGADP